MGIIAVAPSNTAGWQRPLIVFGWWGTVFLSSTRMIFASAFDRILPEGVARVSSSGVPYVALLLMVIPSIIVSALYAYQTTFVQLTYDATVVIAIMFLGSGLAFMIMPWRVKSICKGVTEAKPCATA